MVDDNIPDAIREAMDAILQADSKRTPDPSPEREATTTRPFVTAYTNA